MEILQITADMVVNGLYAGPDVSNYSGHIHISAGLGCVKFTGSLMAAGRIRAGAGSGIEAGEGIEAGWGIKAGEGIEAGFSVCAKWVSARLRIFVGLCMYRLPTVEESQLRAELRSGTLAFGEHVQPVTDGQK